MKTAMNLALWLLVSCVLLFIKQGLCEETRKIYFLTILPFPSEVPSLQPSWDAGTRILPAAYLAVEMINNRSDVLPGYTLDLIIGDGGCDMANNARISFVDHIISRREKPIVGIIGPGCSSSTLAVLPLINHPQVSLLNIHLAGSPLVEDRTKYPHSIGILNSARAFINSTVALIREAEWKRVAILYDEERLYFLSTYQLLEESFERLLPNAEIAFSSAVYPTYIPLDEIRRLNIRVVFVLTGPEFARKIMCLASQKNLLYPNYQWVLSGRDFNEFEDLSFYQTYDCLRDHLKYALNGNIIVNAQLHLHDENTTKSNVSYREYLDLYKERIELYNAGKTHYKAPGDPNANASRDIHATIVFDAIWALALVLQKSGVNPNNYGLRLGQNDSETTSSIQSAFYKTEFQGVSGHISFDNTTGFTNRILEILQVFDDLGPVLVGTVEGYNFMPKNSPKFIRDEFRIQLVHPSIAAILLSWTVITLIVTIMAHITTIIHRDNAAVKAHSPKLNHVSYVGAYLFTAGTLLSIVHESVPIDEETYANTCQAIWAWLFSISFTMFFTPICAHTWRLYRIFTHYLDPGPLISEPVLFSAVAVLVVLDVVLASTWTALDPFHSIKWTVKVEESGVSTERLKCDCDYIFVWFPLIYGLDVFLLISTVILSLLTRNNNNKQFKTSSIRVFVYLFAISWSIGILMYYTTTQNLNSHVAILAVMCNILLLLALLLVFFPPIHPIVKAKLERFGKNWNYEGKALAR